MTELDAGVTLLNGTGAYSGQDKRVVLCVIKKSLVSKALRLIKNVDSSSFAIITTANEVFGRATSSTVKAAFKRRAGLFRKGRASGRARRKVLFFMLLPSRSRAVRA